MTNQTRWRQAFSSVRLAPVLATLAVVAMAGPVAAQPVYKDLKRFGPPPPVGPALTLLPPPTASVSAADGYGRPPRNVTGGPGYVGSDYGLGKPSFTGLGSRPDWGR